MLRKFKSFLCTLLVMFVAQKQNYFTAKRLFRFIFLTPFRVSEIFFLSKNIKSRVYEFLIHFSGLSTITNWIVANIRSYEILKIEFNHHIFNQYIRRLDFVLLDLSMLFIILCYLQKCHLHFASH